MRNDPVSKFESPNHRYRKKAYCIAATYFFHEGPQFPVVPWHLPFPVVLFVGARRVRAWRVLKRRPRAKVKMHRHANPSRKFISWTLSGCITWVEYERHGWFTEMNPVWWKTLGCARRLLDRRSVGACQVSGARNLAFIVPTCSISPVLTRTPWNLEAICRARDSAITIYRRVSPIVNSLLLDGSKAVQKESSPDPTFFFSRSRARETGYRFYSRDPVIYYRYPYGRSNRSDCKNPTFCLPRLYRRFEILRFFFFKSSPVACVLV